MELLTSPAVPHLSYAQEANNNISSPFGEPETLSISPPAIEQPPTHPTMRDRDVGTPTTHNLRSRLVTEAVSNADQSTSNAGNAASRRKTRSQQAGSSEAVTNRNGTRARSQPLLAARNDPDRDKPRRRRATQLSSKTQPKRKRVASNDSADLDGDQERVLPGRNVSESPQPPNRKRRGIQRPVDSAPPDTNAGQNGMYDCEEDIKRSENEDNDVRVGGLQEGTREEMRERDKKSRRQGKSKELNNDNDQDQDSRGNDHNVPVGARSEATGVANYRKETPVQARYNPSVWNELQETEIKRYQEALILKQAQLIGLQGKKKAAEDGASKDDTEHKRLRAERAACFAEARKHEAEADRILVEAEQLEAKVERQRDEAKDCKGKMEVAT
ncbi:MAG: hypothetical protein Q9226_006219, partial [Calogaya cf. arnoldii]